MPTKRTIRVIGPVSKVADADVVAEKSDEPPSRSSAGSSGASAGVDDRTGSPSSQSPSPPSSPPLQPNVIRLPALLPIRNGAPPQAIERQPVNIDRFTVQQRSEERSESADDLGADSDEGCAVGSTRGVYSTDLPLIVLFGPTENELPAVPAEIVIGRRHILMPFYRACGCLGSKASERRSGKKTKRLSLCDGCRSVEDWGSRFLSRKMIKLVLNATNSQNGADDTDGTSDDMIGPNGKHISSFLVQARGENAPWFVRVDGKPVVSRPRPPEKGGASDDNSGHGWGGDSILAVGSELVLELPDGGDESVGAERRLVFRLADIVVELGASGAESGEGKRPERERVVRFGPNSSSTIEDGAETTDPTSTQSPAEDVPSANVSEKAVLVAGASSTAAVQSPKKVGTPELSPVQDGAIDLTESPPLQVLDDDAKSQEIIDITSIDTPEEAVSKRQCIVYFLRLGRSMSERRVQTLTSNLEKKDGVIQVANTFSARSGVTHVVIDESISPPEVATALGFSDLEQMKKVFTRRKILAVKPDWITKSANIHDEPTFDEYWAGLHGVGQDASKKRPVEVMEPKMETGSHESDDEFARISVVKASSVKGDDDTVSRMYKKRKEEARQRNQGLFEMFMELSKLHKDSPLDEKDDFKQKLYAKVAWRLRYLDFEVVYRKDVLQRLRKIDGFGESVMKKVNEYLMNGSCMKVNELKTNPERLAVRNLKKIHGVGKKKAAELAMQKYATIDDVRAGLASGKIDLSPIARIGVDIYEDLLDRMDHEEVEEIADIVSNAFREKHPKAEVVIMGSYRRGEESSGDCDLLIVDPDYEETTPEGALGELVDRLKQREQIAYHLNKVEGMEGVTKKKKLDRDIAAESDHAQSWMGVFFSPRHKGRHRRVDIKVYPWQDRAYAALYFTGNTAFNRSMRTYAQHRKNMALSDHGLFPINYGGKMMPHEEKKQYRTHRIPASTEEEIFEHLNLVYRGPTERKCFDDVVEK